MAPGARALELVADARHAWIIRELDRGPLTLGELQARTGGAIAHTTLAERALALTAAGATRRDPPGARSAGFAYHLEPLGRDLLYLVDRFVSWRLSSGPAAARLIRNSPSGPPALHALADATTPALLAALAGSPRRLASLERSLRPLTRSQLEHRLRSLVATGLVERRADRYRIAAAGREASAYLALAARLERRHDMPGATPAVAADMADLLCVTAPLLALSPDAEAICESRIAGGDAEQEPPAASCRMTVAGGGVTAARGAVGRWAAPGAEAPAPARTAPEAPSTPVPTEAPPSTPSVPTATASGTVADWCAALLDGRATALRFGGERVEVARALVAGLHERLWSR